MGSDVEEGCHTVPEAGEKKRHRNRGKEIKRRKRSKFPGNVKSSPAPVRGKWNVDRDRSEREAPRHQGQDVGNKGQRFTREGGVSTDGRRE
jgi:hypothetical protein